MDENCCKHQLFRDWEGVELFVLFCCLKMIQDELQKLEIKEQLCDKGTFKHWWG